MVGFAGAGQAPAEAAAPVPPVGATAGTPERLCLQRISSAWVLTFGKALVCKEVTSLVSWEVMVHFSLLAVLPMESLAQKELGEAVPAAPGWVISPWKECTVVSSFLGLSQPLRHGVRHRARRTAAGLAVSRSLHHC